MMLLLPLLLFAHGSDASSVVNAAVRSGAVYVAHASDAMSVAREAAASAVSYAALTATLAALYVSYVASAAISVAYAFDASSVASVSGASYVVFPGFIQARLIRPLIAMMAVIAIAVRMVLLRVGGLV